MSDTLCNSQIVAALSMQAKQHLNVVHVYSVLDSTNRFLLDSNVPDNAFDICVSEEQTQGRGRRGNTWCSSPNKNILMSLSWKFACWPKGVASLSLVIGVLVVERLARDFGVNAQLKWPNDIVVNGEKLAGILVESKSASDGACHIVIGLGLNVEQKTQSQSDYAWADLHSLHKMVDRNRCIAGFASDWVEALLAFAQSGFSPYMPFWQKRSFLTGKMVRVDENGERIVGKVLGVHSDGALILQLQHQVRHINLSATQVRLIDE